MNLSNCNGVVMLPVDRKTSPVDKEGERQMSTHLAVQTSIDNGLLFEPDPLVQAQYYRTTRRTYYSSPELRLMAAVLEDAVATLTTDQRRCSRRWAAATAVDLSADFPHSARLDSPNSAAPLAAQRRSCTHCSSSTCKHATAPTPLSSSALMSTSRQQGRAGHCQLI